MWSVICKRRGFHQSQWTVSVTPGEALRQEPCSTVSALRRQGAETTCGLEEHGVGSGHRRSPALGYQPRASVETQRLAVHLLHPAQPPAIHAHELMTHRNIQHRDSPVPKVCPLDRGSMRFPRIRKAVGRAPGQKQRPARMIRTAGSISVSPDPSLRDVLADAGFLLRPGVQPLKALSAGRLFAGPRVDHRHVSGATGQQASRSDQRQVSYGQSPHRSGASPVGRAAAARFHQPPPSAWKSAVVSASRLAWAWARVISAC